MFDIHNKLSFELLLVAGIIPLLAMSRTILTGLFCGLIIIVLILLTALLIFLLRPYISQDQKWLMIILTASILVGTGDRMLETFLPELHTIYGLYLPLLVVVPLCSLIPAETGIDTSLADVLSTAGKVCQLYFPVIVLFGGLREIIMTGSLLTDSGLLLGADYSLRLMNGQLVLVSRVAGALMLVGLLLAGFNKVKSD